MTLTSSDSNHIFTGSRHLLTAPLLVALLLTAQPAARCEQVSWTARIKESATVKLAGTHIQPSKDPHGMQLDDIQDVSTTLQRIRQQAINMAVECSRKKTTSYEINNRSLSSMPDISKVDASCLPLRKGWLAYFVATMEPLVQILVEQLKDLDTKANEETVPLAQRPRWHAIGTEWKASMKELNQELDVCAAMLDDPSCDNVKVAKAAAAIDDDVTVLDGILHRASAALQEADAAAAKP